MKRKTKVILAVVAVATVGLVALAQKQPKPGNVYLLKAGGQTIAELHLRPSANVTIEVAGEKHSAGWDYNLSTKSLVARGDVVLRLRAGTNAISVRANEIENLPESP